MGRWTALLYPEGAYLNGTHGKTITDMDYSKEDIEYPVAGGGIYSTTSDYTKLLQELLKLFRTPEERYPNGALLSRKSVQSLFQGSLPESAKEALTNVMNMRPPQPEDLVAPGTWDWSTGLAVWSPADGRRLGRDDDAEEGGWGRRSGAAGWFGAAGTMYFIDPQSNLTVRFLLNSLFTYAYPRFHLSLSVRPRCCLPITLR